MKNVLMLETHDEILNAHMHGDYPELALIIPAKEAEQSETPMEQLRKIYEVGKHYPDKGVYAGELKKEDGFYGVFVSLKDFEDEDCEDEFTWNKAMGLELPEGYRVPDIRELTLIHLNIEDVNAGLTAANGEKLESWYWSSTEYGNTSAWGFAMGNGSRYNSSKNGNNNYVRPVLAVKL